MGKALIGLIGLIVGAVIGAIFVAPLLTGTAAGIGVATGLSAGICSTVQAAQEEDLLTAEEIDRILNRAAANMAELSGEAAPDELAGGLEECGAVMERLRAAQ